MTFREVDDGLAVTESGEGPGVLWIHGYTMDSSVWRDLWERLPGWRHLGLDLPWHGGSRGLRPREDLAALADTVTGLARARDVRHVVALSFGTVLALEMAMRAPRSAASWTFAAPALLGGPHDEAVEARYVELAIAYHRRGPGPHLRQLWMSTPPDVFRGAAERPQLHDVLATVIDRHRWSEMAGFGMRALTSAEQDPGRLRQVRVPVLLLLGEHELPAYRRCAEQVAASAPRSVVEVVAGAGHLAPLEEPVAAAAAIAAHLSAAEVCELSR